jgi:diacylglycerol kinase (ATP)
MTVLVSSMSARGRAVRVGPSVVRRLQEGGWRVEVRVTTSDDDPGAVAAEAAVRSRCVAALGGDGFIAAVAQGLVGSQAVLVPLPGGRGNDLCRSIGAGPDPVARAVSLAPLGLAERPWAGSDPWGLGERVRSLDGMWVEDAQGARRLALGVVSLGLDAWANKLANDSWLRSGPMAYAWGALTTPAHFHGAGFRARVDGAELDLPGWVFSVSNSGFIGGGVHVVPSSDPFDGVLELFRVDQVPLHTVLPAVIQVVAQRNADHPLVHLSSVREVEVLAPEGLPAMADGDLVGHLPLRVSVAPGVVRVLV